MTAQTAAKRKNEAPAEIEIVRSWCKSCAICVEFCPKDVLEMQDGYPVAVRPEECNRCNLCDARCPDFAIYVR